MSVFKLEKLRTQLFYINQYCVDASRNTVSLNGNVQTVEPKVMQLLLVLVLHNGKVVPQEVLFEQVWPNSIFSPGSIRRAITILRKVLGTNSSDNLLRTIPKKGYELNAKISFHRKQKITNKLLYSGILILLFVLFIVVTFFDYDEIESKTFISQVQPLTASSASEFNAKLSPDDKYIAFMRMSNSGDEAINLWVKDIASNNEKLIYSGLVNEFTWLSNNQGIVFTNKSHNALFLLQTNLVTADVTQLIALSDHIQPASSLQLGKHEQLFLLGRSTESERSSLENIPSLWSIDLKTKKIKETLKFDMTFLPYEINTSMQKNQIAIAGFNQQGISEIKVFDLNSNELISRNIELDKNRYFLSWHPFEKSLLLSDGRHLSSITFSGKWQQFNYESYNFVQHPQYTQDASAIIFSYGKLDIDVAQMALDGKNSIIKLIDSNTVDRAPSISPDGKKLAFISHRKGFPQVYVLDLKTKSLMLAYENSQHLLGVSSPIWGGNDQLAFSNYDFPILVTIEKSRPQIHQFKHPIGVVADFYQDNALLVYSSKRKVHLKVDIDTEEVLHSNPYIESPPKLGFNNELCFVVKQEFRCTNQSQQTNVFNFTGEVLGWHKSGDKFLFTEKGNQGNKLIIISGSDYQRISRFDIPASIDKVFAMYDKQILFEQTNMDRDIIKLILNEPDVIRD